MKKVFVYQKIISISAFVFFAVKWLLWYYTRSLAVLSDAVEGFVNLAMACFSWYSLWLTMKPKDRAHPYGHGKIEFVTTSIEGILLFIAGIGIFYSTIDSIFSPIQISHLEDGIWGLMLVGGLQVALSLIGKKKAKRYNQLVLYSSSQHLLVDAYTTIAFGASLTIIYFTGRAWIDIVCATLMGSWVIYNGYRMFRIGIGGIMDESDDKLLGDIIACIESHRSPQWIDLHNLRVIKYGSVLHVDCHLTLPWYWTVEQAHYELDGLNDIIKKKFGRQVEMFIHTDSCLAEDCCKICSMETCAHRRHHLEKILAWNISNVTKEHKHIYESRHSVDSSL